MLAQRRRRWANTNKHLDVSCFLGPRFVSISRGFLLGQGVNGSQWRVTRRWRSLSWPDGPSRPSLGGVVESRLNVDPTSPALDPHWVSKWPYICRTSIDKVWFSGWFQAHLSTPNAIALVQWMHFMFSALLVNLFIKSENPPNTDCERQVPIGESSLADYFEPPWQFIREVP